MTLTAHILVGGAISASIQNPLIGLPLAAATHPLMDLLPHWDVGWGWRQKTKQRLFLECVADLILGLVAAYLLFGRFVDPIYFLLAAFFSIFWDLMEGPYLILGWKIPPFYTFYSIQHKLQGKSKSVFGGILTQVGVVAGMALVLRFFQ